MAQGFLHDFEGWVVFMASLAVLLAEMWVLNRIGRSKVSFHDAFFIELPGPLPEGVRFKPPALAAPAMVLLVLMLAGAAWSRGLPERQELVPQRQPFSAFPADIEDWTGQVERLESIYIDALKFDDYLLADYSRPTGEKVNLYVAFYGSQRKGASVHSPRSCLPGGGWEMASLDQHRVDGATVNGRPLRVNRSLIKKGDAAQLVYYWFQQRGRVMTNEYLVKWYLFLDAVARHRTDGALVRLTTVVPPTGDVADADRALSDLARKVAPELEDYIPN